MVDAYNESAHVTSPGEPDRPHMGIIRSSDLTSPQKPLHPYVETTRRPQTVLLVKQASS